MHHFRLLHTNEEGRINIGRGMYGDIEDGSAVLY